MPEPTDKPADDATGAAAAAAAAAAAEAAKSETPKKLEFTQEELDRIIADRVSRAKPKDYDDLVKLRDDRAAEAEKEKTDLQKAQDRARTAEESATKAITTANGILKRAAIIELAAAQNAADADTVVALLAGDDSITVEDGDVKGVKQAVKKLLESKPFLVKTQAAGQSGGQFGGNDAQTLQEKIKEAESKGDFETSRKLKLQQVQFTS